MVSHIAAKCQKRELSLPSRPSHQLPRPLSCWQGVPAVTKTASAGESDRTCSKKERWKRETSPQCSRWGQRWERTARQSASIS